MKTVKDVRSEFLNYFAGQGHEVVPSSSLIPHNDPTLMFVNSGMVQFKDIFTGKETRPYTRATTAQKSVRAGGKHNDLDNVGYTARHHTFFEMMGNFSFGDYFKSDAIPFAWDVVTKVLGFSPEKLCVTVYHDDDEAANIWKKVTGFSDSKIIRIDTMDNFWMMGDTGPCGPCSEIFYDHGDKIWGGLPGSAEADGDRFIEIWNLVFMQYEQLADGTRIPLPKPSIDTGMGLERVAAVLQGKHNNYDIDLFQSIIKHSSDLTGVSASGDMVASHRVIADHLRAAAFLIADGVMPSNEGRGYVLRRIMRRGMRHAHLLGAKDPLLVQLFPTLQSTMGEAYPELYRAQALISETLRMEETKFKQTLDRGLKLLDDECSSLGNGQTLAGDVAFKLYDTYGFPLDLTQDALKERNIGVDTKGFNVCMDRQKAEARKAWAGSGDVATETVWYELAESKGATEFLGYDKELSEAEIVAIVKNGVLVDQAQTGDEVQIVLNQTPFYAESGGQIGDTGTLIGDSSNFAVENTAKKLGKLHVHVGRVCSGSFKVGQGVEAIVDHARRSDIRVHHSVTHLLHEALRQTLGDHVAQKGSLQTSDRTRFDVSHPVAMTMDQIQTVERMVNREIWADTPVVTKLMDLEEAQKSGARALFGEKYDTEVRVVSMGRPDNNGKIPFSVELCGGTHVSRTGEIGLFKIVTESAVGSGIRRVEAVAGATALAYLEEQEHRLMETAGVLKANAPDVVDRVKALLDEKKKLEQELTNLRRKMATGGGANDSAPQAKEIGGVKFISRILDDVPAKDLKSMADDFKTQIGSGVVTLIASFEGKVSIVVAVTDDLTSKISAVDLVRAGAEAMGGKGGGGRPDMAQAGGTNADAANDAVLLIEKMIG
ncbi:MAG: alanine--tRNA ligase [Alphaproteobacteria bacterium]|jgi:alanyl-tRNA synthetase|nr:alanine--tRNA ligase [Alphaproteobacteria bacterium]